MVSLQEAIEIAKRQGYNTGQISQTIQRAGQSAGLTNQQVVSQIQQPQTQSQVQYQTQPQVSSQVRQQATSQGYSTPSFTQNTGSSYTSQKTPSQGYTPSYTPSYTPGYTTPKSQTDTYTKTPKIDFGDTSYKTYTGEKTPGITLSSGQQYSDFSSYKPVDLGKLSKYGQEAITTGTDIAKRNDIIAYNLYGQGAQSKEDIANYLMQQQGFAQAPETDRLNTINAIANRMGITQETTQPTQTPGQQQLSLQEQLLQSYQTEQGKIMEEGNKIEFVKRMDNLLGSTVRELNDSEVMQLAQETGLPFEVAKQTAQSYNQARTKIQEPFKQREEDLELEKQRSIEDANQQLERTKTQINDRINDVTTEMNRNVAVMEKMGALTGKIRSSGFGEGMENVKSDAQKIIGRLQSDLSNATSDTAKYTQRVGENFTRNMDRLQKSFSDQMLNLRLAGSNELNGLLAKYSPSDEILKNELGRIEEEYGLKSMDMYSKFLNNFKGITDTAMYESEKLQDFQIKQRQLQDLTINNLMSNNGIALMGMTDQDLQAMAKSGQITTQDVSMLKGMRDQLKSQKEQTKLGFKDVIVGYDDEGKPIKKTVTYDQYGNIKEMPTEGIFGQKTTNMGTKDWDIDYNVGDPISVPGLSGKITTLEQHKDGNISMEIIDTNGNKVELNHLDPSVYEMYGLTPGNYSNLNIETDGNNIGIAGNTGDVKDAQGNRLRKNGVVTELGKTKLKEGFGSHLDLRVVKDGVNLTGQQVKEYLSGVGGIDGLKQSLSEDARAVLGGFSIKDYPTDSRPKIAKELNKYFEKIKPMVKDKNEFDIMKSAIYGGGVNEGSNKVLNAISDVKYQLEGLTETLNKTDTGPLRELREKSSDKRTDQDTALLRSQLEAIIPGLARGVFGEVGVLTDQDIERYRKTIPNLGNKNEVNKAIADNLMGMLKNKFISTVTTESKNKNNVADWLDDYKYFRDLGKEQPKQPGTGGFLGKTYRQAEQLKQEASKYEDIIGGTSQTGDTGR